MILVRLIRTAGRQGGHTVQGGDQPPGHPAPAPGQGGQAPEKRHAPAASFQVGNPVGQADIRVLI